MQAYTELAAPSAVTHSLSIALTSPSANNLVVAKGSLLQIFHTKLVAEDDTGDKPEIPTDDGLENSFLGGESIVRTDRTNTKLVLVAEIPLAGTVIGLAKISLSKTSSGGDALLLAYKAAKMCLAEWDPKKNTLETISIHYYEKDDLQGAPWELPFGEYVNYLEPDPGSRCAAFKFGSRNLAILPFKKAEEDLAMDWDEDLDGPRPEPVTNGENGENGVEAAYTPSFVLRLPLLDPSLLHPVHLSFLHEYREPTFGVISPVNARSAALGAKDQMTYKVFTLDLKQRASTTILSVTGLPQDLTKIVALPAPVGGALLLGQNELIHVDQSGKANGVAVNPMAKRMTGFSLSDQSELDLRLEDCAVEVLSMEHGEMLLVLNDGQLATVSFKIDGRTVSGISVKMVKPENGGGVLKARPSTVTKIGKNAFFIGSEVGDSVVLGFSRKQAQEKRKRRVIDPDLDLDVDDLDLEDDDDDLYGDGPVKPQANGVKSGELTFRVHDTMLSIAPIQDFTSGTRFLMPDSEDKTNHKGVTAKLELGCAVGRGAASALAIINREIQPKVIGRFEFPEARGFWTMCVKKPAPKALGVSAETDYDTPGQFDRFMIVAKVDLDGYETSDVYALTGAGFETLKDTEFEPAAGFTVEAGTMGKQSRVIQVLKSEVRCYDGDLGLTQILPMLDEETGAEPRAVSASIADPYLLLIRDDSSVFIAKMDNSYELEEVEKEGNLSGKWLAGCLYKDTTGVFKEKDAVMMFLLSSAGALHIYALPDLSNPVFVAEGLSYVPPFLSADYTVRRGTAREALTELLVADLGDVISSTPHLILRHSTDDLTIYEPIRTSSSLIFKKASNPALAKSMVEATHDDANEQPRFVPMRICSNVGGHSAVFLPGASPSFILKSAQTIPRVVGLQGIGIRGMSTFHTEGCDRGFIYADSQGIARVTQLPDANFTALGLSVKKIPLPSDVRKLAFHTPSGTYIAACSVSEPFTLPPDDDNHKEWAKESLPPSFTPTMPRGVLHLISPQTWTSIHSHDFESCESIESMKALYLEVSEDTRERRMLLAVGTALSKGEDLPTRGRIHVLDVVSVIPHPDHPETNRRLKLITREEIPRGGVTDLSEIGSQGLMLVAQGQKCMVRGLKEDGSLPPVAFLDMSCHVVSVKTLPGTGLALMADAFKGVWFAGYTEEPYTFKVLGKSNGRVPLLNANFLPDGDDLSIVASDANGELHILEFNPDHHKSIQGHLLLHRTSFTVTPHEPTSSLLLPRTGAVIGSGSTGHILLMASASGQLSALTPLPESTYRRLLSATNQLLPALAPHGGLNAKAYRTGTSGRHVGVDTASGRVVVDGAVLTRWAEMGAGKRAEVAGRGGYDSVAEMREELLGLLGWSGLAYF